MKMMKYLIFLAAISLNSILIIEINAQVIVKKEGVSNPINFLESIQKIKQTIDFTNSIDKAVFYDLKSEINFNSFIIESLKSVSSNTKLSLGIINSYIFFLNFLFLFPLF